MVLLSPHKQNQKVALPILRKIVLEGRRIKGILFENTYSSPSNLAWLSTLKLLKYNSSGLDPKPLQLYLLVGEQRARSSGSHRVEMSFFQVDRLICATQ